MSFYYMLLIMLVTGAFGGIINFFLPENNPTKKEYLKPWYNCIILGLGATLLVPLFLELAQSKLMDNIRFDTKLEAPKQIKTDSLAAKTTAILNAKTGSDSLKIAQLNALVKEKNTSAGNENQGKNYLLWTAYCLLAGAAGFKFINMLISGVFKANKINELESDKAKLESEKEKRTKQAQKNQEEELKKVIHKKAEPKIKGLTDINLSLLETENQQPLILNLPPVTVSNDPQKGRFGGKDTVHGRQLKAIVNPTENDDYFAVDIWVEATETDKPLKTEVLFFLHDSFSPSVRKAIAEDGKKAALKTLIAYGAFTVGAVTDNGETLLELDLSFDTNENKYPKKFKER